MSTTPTDMAVNNLEIIKPSTCFKTSTCFKPSTWCHHSRRALNTGAVPDKMTRFTTAIANRAIHTISSQVASLATIIAGLVIRTVCHNMPRQIALLAEC